MKKKSDRYINPLSGEFIDVDENQRIIIITNEQDKFLKKKKELELNLKILNDELGGFIFILFKYCDNLLLDHKELSQEDIVRLFYLATFANKEFYFIRNNKFMKRSNINNILQISRTNFDIFFNKMINLKIFIQNTNDKHIKINSNFFTSGKISDEIKKYYNYTRLYVKTIRYLFENVDKNKHRYLGRYFKLIPFIHRQKNILCWNPESKIDDMSMMHISDIQGILNFDGRTVRKFIKELLSIRLMNGESIIGLFRTEIDESESYIIINPKVFYGGNFDLPEGMNSILKWFY